jgi:hypothetical protein
MEMLYSHRYSENIEIEVNTVNRVIGNGWRTGAPFPSGKRIYLFVEIGPDTQQTIKYYITLYFSVLFHWGTILNCKIFRL